MNTSGSCPLYSKDERIFECLTWLRVDEPEGLAGAATGTVEAVEGDVVRLESVQCFVGSEMLKHTRLCSAIAYVLVLELTRGRVLNDVESPHFTLKHLYMGCSLPTNSELSSFVKFDEL